MRRIFKYPVDTGSTQTQLLTLPKNSRVLSVANQDNNLVLWAIVDTEETELESHLVTIAATGSPLPDIQNADFLGTVLFKDDKFVLHVFHEKVWEVPTVVDGVMQLDKDNPYHREWLED